MPEPAALVPVHRREETPRAAFHAVTVFLLAAGVVDARAHSDHPDAKRVIESVRRIRAGVAVNPVTGLPAAITAKRNMDALTQAQA